MNLIETYELLDAIFFDEAVTGHKNSNWNNYNNRLSLETDETGTLLTGYASSNGYYIANASDPFIFDDYCCEFDIITKTGLARWYHQNNNNQTGNVFILDSVPVGHAKIICQNGTAKLYIDDVQVRSADLTVAAPYEIAFRFNTGTGNTLKYANFIVYPI